MFECASRPWLRITSFTRKAVLSVGQSSKAIWTVLGVAQYVRTVITATWEATKVLCHLSYINP